MISIQQINPHIVMHVIIMGDFQLCIIWYFIPMQLKLSFAND